MLALEPGPGVCSFCFGSRDFCSSTFKSSHKDNNSLTYYCMTIILIFECDSDDQVRITYIGSQIVQSESCCASYLCSDEM